VNEKRQAVYTRILGIGGCRDEQGLEKGKEERKEYSTVHQDGMDSAIRLLFS